MHLVITGVRTRMSIAWWAAYHAMNAGHDVILAVAPSDEKRALRAVRDLPGEPIAVIPYDASRDDNEPILTERLRSITDTVDGVLHAIAWAPPSCLEEPFTSAPWDDVAQAINISAYSLTRLTRAVVPLMTSGGDIVALTLDSTVTWDTYNWMGVAKATLETSARYLARQMAPQGIRVNTVTAGLVDTLASKGIEGTETYRAAFRDRSMLAWDSSTAADPVGKTCVTLMTGQMPVTTGTIVFADGGLHKVGDYTNPERIPRLQPRD